MPYSDFYPLEKSDFRFIFRRAANHSQRSTLPHLRKDPVSGPDLAVPATFAHLRTEIERSFQ